MDTKLKNNNKRGNLLTVISTVDLICRNAAFYPAFSSYITDQDQKEMPKRRADAGYAGSDSGRKLSVI